MSEWKPFLLVAGPCMLESDSLAREVAVVVRDLQKKYTRELKVFFKASFDKANRTSSKSSRGPGLKSGLQTLGKIGADFSLPLLTDIHETHQVEAVSQVCDVLQIPAFLCRQTDLLEAAGKSGKIVNIKKGQFLAPEDLAYAVEKVRAGGGQEIWQTERGTSFGYHNLVVDMRSFPIMKQAGTPVIFDATHSVQRPSGEGGKTGGDRRLVPTLLRAAVAAGVDGLFIETHPDPDHALSDGPNMVPLDKLTALVEEALTIRQVVQRMPLHFQRGE